MNLVHQTFYVDHYVTVEIHKILLYIKNKQISQLKNPFGLYKFLAL